MTFNDRVRGSFKKEGTFLLPLKMNVFEPGVVVTESFNPSTQRQPNLHEFKAIKKKKRKPK